MYVCGMIFISFTVSIIFYNIPKNTNIMANTGKTVATLLIGAAVGAAVGYVLATDKDTRSATMDKLKDRLNNLKSKLARKGEDLEEEIYNA